MTDETDAGSFEAGFHLSQHSVTWVRRCARSKSLWSIAKRTRADDSVAIHEQVDAIFRLNPHAFADDSIDSLLRGTKLMLPEDRQGTLKPSDSPRSETHPGTVTVIRGVSMEELDLSLSR